MPERQQIYFNNPTGLEMKPGTKAAELTLSRVDISQILGKISPPTDVKTR